MILKNANSKIIGFLTVLSILFSNYCDAQTTSFITIGMEQGLVQNQVQTITQDNEGNLWIGTIAGLTKYNGSDFTNYTRQNGLAEDWITCSYKDKSGNIWFGHWAGNVTLYNSISKKFENLNFEEYSRFKSIRDIVEDSEGRFWIATEGAGLFIFEPKENKMFSLSRKDGLSSNTIYDICFDDNKNVWMASDSGLTLYNLEKPISNSASFIQISSRDGLFSDNITCVHYSSNNELWLGSADNGVSMIAFPKKINSDFKGYVSKNQTLMGEAKGLKSNFIKTISENHNKVIAIGTIGGGASIFVPEIGNVNRSSAVANGSFKTYSTREGLNYFNVNAIFEDRETNIWIGTDLGLNQFRGERLQTFDELDLISNNIVWSVYKDVTGNIWLGTNSGVSKLSITYSKDNHVLNKTVTNYGKEQGLPTGAVLAVFQDSKGNMWFGTGTSGAYMLPAGGKALVRYNASNGLPSEVIYSIAEDNNGNIWFGTKEGASRLTTSTGSIRNFTIADGLGGNHVYRIFKDKAGLLWIGALGGNLSVYDGNSFKKFDENNGLNDKFILCINEDNVGNIWFGCYGGGLYKFDGKNFKNYSAKDGLKTESPFSVIADKDNNIWIGDNRGVEKFDTKKNKFVHYGKAEGFQGVECNPNAICLDEKGNIWFGTIMGAVKFNPQEDLPNTAPPITKIYGLQIHLRDTVFPAGATFAYDENNITFKFVGVTLTNPEKLRYEYTLEGFDRGWIPVNHLTQQAVYTNLPSGIYKFKVRAYNNDGLLGEAAEYAFTVKPPFWQTAAFYVFVIVFTVFGIYVFDKIRTRRLKIKNQELEKKVEDRTIQLAIKNGELAEKNKDITDSIRYAKRIQDTMLPSKELMFELVPNSFILFLPKDIVSGDFYWSMKKGDSTYIAAVDCTGHGVPGAFLSIVANNLLVQSVEECNTASPGAILNHLNKLASTALKSKVDQYQLRDGMDLSLCRIDKKTKMIEYSGAYNNLYLVRQNKLIEYQSDHLSIGTLEGNQSYTNHSFSYEPGDKIYLFSDGFADQFGGDKGKKFKYSHFQEIIVKNNNLSMEDQRAILENSFYEWKGALEQIDDVLVIGMTL